jgi:quinolinate synthase
VPAHAAPASVETIAELQDEVRALAREQDALVLAHVYQRPEVQDVADFVGDTLALLRRATDADQRLIALCGVHFMAETASVLCPDKTVLLPGRGAGCSLVDAIDAEQLRAWKAEHPGAVVVMHANTSARVKAEADYCCTSASALRVVQHVWRTRGYDAQILFGPDMWLGAQIERVTGRRLQVWLGECHVHATITPQDIEEVRSEHPGAELLIHPECGCTTSAMVYVASGDVGAERCRVLPTGALLAYARRADETEFIVASEAGMLHRLRTQSPDKRFIPFSRMAVCGYMKRTTLPRLRDTLRDRAPEVRVAPVIAARARLPIERMIAIS